MTRTPVFPGPGTPTVTGPDERRPSRRDRTSLFGSSVYNLSRDVLYTSYRYYRDTWGIRSHTLDLRYRLDFDGDRFVQPHVRYYTQTAADFFRYSLVEGAPTPEFASADRRLGPLHTLTLGVTYGFRPPRLPGELTVRGEWIHQWGDAHPASAVGEQRQFDLSPPLEIGTLHVGYTLQF